MNPAPADIATVLWLLAATPQRLAALSHGQPYARLHIRRDPDTWSPNDILAHVRACADVWGKGIMAMITQDDPTMRYVSPRTWIKKTDYLELEFTSSLQAFTRQRQELLKTLAALDQQDWTRGATFTATTRGREQTVFSYAQRIAQHEHEHCEYIETLLKDA